MSVQTTSALRKILHSNASRIEDFLNGYKFVMTAQFQSIPIERRFRQYHQKKTLPPEGGKFLVSLKDVLCPEQMIKIKSFAKR